ncbi:FimV/HubP family polar landmark protein [Microbulbifer yueqingensis]|uniref:Pilus assembly protein FimV n=1 Tax=Microbulbifer yueqingensis TaxID=658219 RepID=A0A1G8V519_9GAMM|nr:FimV/HubP family polar landmark protein [Microbulbifer yueqingensis]SDJ61079.1 pilus assembly protein FimV [Microbulbifer yueqingensis]
MRVRKLALAVGMVSALSGNAALALGLGEIKLNSTLNEPLEAQISLLQSRGLGEGEIKVRLASPEDFERAGVDRSYLLTDLQFEVDYSGAQPVIRVSSKKAIREPFLNFLVETRWPSGRLLREYTLLMDLPAFSTTAAQQPVRAAERERQQVRRQPAPPQTTRAPEPRPQVQEQAPRPTREVAEEPRPQAQQPETQQPEKQQPEKQQPEAQPPAEAQQPAAEEPMELQREPSAAESASSQVYGPVSANQTLWEIARDNRTHGDVTVQQTMLAIQRLNPEAFINGNINLLKKGAVLRLPDISEVRAVSRGDAVAQVAAQNDAWRQRTGTGEAATGAPLDARAASGDSTATEAVEGRVSLAAPGDNESVQSGSGSGAEDSEALEGELAVTEEELDKSRLENEELKERISELDEQIDTMEQLVEVSNEEMAAIQAAAQQSSAAGEETDSAESTEEENVATDSTVGSEAAAIDQGSDETTAAEETAATEADSQPADARNRVVSVQTSQEPTLLERLMENIQLIGIGAGVFLLGVVGFMSWRRRKEEEEAMRQVEADMAAERALADAPEIEEKDENLAAVESFETSDDFDMDQFEDVDTGDPVSEAEIHLSLGQYSDAEAKLVSGLEKDPQHVDARLMLLEVYAHQQNIDKFDDHYRQLLSVSDGPAADRAARLRESIDGAAPFEGGDETFTSESLEAMQLDDLSSSYEEDFSSDFSSGSDSAGGSEAGEGDSSLLDDLTMDLGEESDFGSDSRSSDEEDFSLDLDLGSDLGDAEGFGAESGDSGDSFDFDDLMSGDLDLGGEAETGDSAEPASDELDSLSLDLDDDFGSAGTGAAEGETTAEDAGLDFDLDLSPMEEEESSGDLEFGSAATDSEVTAEDKDAASDQVDELSLDDFDDSFGDDLGSGLDLDSIDLDEFDGELNAGSGAAEEDATLTAEPEPELELAESTTPSSDATQPAASSDTGGAFGDLNFDLGSDLDSELNLLEGSDELGTKLELAQAYVDMGDKDGARDILAEVAEEGSDEYKTRAREMLERIS